MLHIFVSDVILMQYMSVGWSAPKMKFLDSPPTDFDFIHGIVH